MQERICGLPLPGGVSIPMQDWVYHMVQYHSGVQSLLFGIYFRNRKGIHIFMYICIHMYKGGIENKRKQCELCIA